MKYAEIAENVEKLVAERPTADEFIYELLLAYGRPKATIARLKSGQINLSKVPGEVLLKKWVWFRPIFLTTESTEGDKEWQGDLLAAMEDLKSVKGTKTNDPRFLIVTDFEQMLALDRKTEDTLDIELSELATNFDFFLPWAGMEKTKLSNENPADVKAAEKMAKLFDAIKQDNLGYVRDNPHWMNIFLSRLLFCLFAEDTGIFPENAISNAIASQTAVDGSDLAAFFAELFDWLDRSDRERFLTTHPSPEAMEGRREGTEHTENRVGQASSLSEEEKPLRSLAVNFKDLPYVNGGLFRDHYPIPTFSAKPRRMIIEAGKLIWAEINPDIFGSMFQAVIDPEERHNLGQHYTSVTNIMKVIEPLFLNDFKADLEKVQDMNAVNGDAEKDRKLKRRKKKFLHALLDRIANVKIFDPACGSGNFLIIAYKELRRLEMAVFKELQSIEGFLPLSRMTVSQFYGIEIDDFAHETAILALWLTEHQMNLEYKKTFGQTIVSLPLKEGANIVCGNATRLEWETVCPKNEGDEIYILGNPPYLGSSMQNKEQKADMAYVFDGIKNYKNLDYIACWFLKGAEYIQDRKTQYAFVSTNSICQGEQVALLWPHIFAKGLEIGFAHQSFKWSNNAKSSAAVICVIVGLRNIGNEASTIFRHGVAQNVKVINAYLTYGSNVVVYKRSKSLSDIPKMSYGSKPVDGGNLILNSIERLDLMKESASAGALIKKFVGSSEFIKGIARWCLWIEDENLTVARSIPSVAQRIDRVAEMRLSSKKQATQKSAQFPHQFGEIRYKKAYSVVVPETSSERRDYIPVGYLNADTIISNSAYCVPEAAPIVFAVLSSRMHMAWMRVTCGRLKTDYRYSAGLCYNTFPISDLTEAQKQTITMHVGNVLEEREKHPEKTMAQLYDPDKMPDGLREAHHNLDLAVDRLYRSKPFASDEERLEHLFKLYEEMIEREEDRNTPKKKLLKKKLIPALEKSQAYFTLDQIKDSVSRFKLSNEVLKNYLSEFVKEGVLYNAGRGWYSKIKEPLVLDPDPVKMLAELLKRKFPFLGIACWSTKQINPYMHHLLSKSICFIYVDRDAMDTAASVLREDDWTVFVNPSKADIERFVIIDDKTVVIRPAHSKQPMDASGIALAEKFFVDLVIENERFSIMEKTELKKAIIQAISDRRIDMGKFQAYQKERRIADLIGEINEKDDYLRKNNIFGYNN